MGTRTRTVNCQGPVTRARSEGSYIIARIRGVTCHGPATCGLKNVPSAATSKIRKLNNDTAITKAFSGVSSEL